VRIDVILSGINILMAISLVGECLRGWKPKSFPLLVVLLCAAAYAVLEVEWLLTDQSGQIGDLRSLLWLLIEFGLLFGCYAGFRRIRLQR